MLSFPIPLRLLFAAHAPVPRDFRFGRVVQDCGWAFSGGLAVAIAVIVSYRNLDPTRMQIADTLGLSAFRRLFWYELPEMAPSLFVGIRTAASLCLILVVVGEMFIGSRDGLGKMIMDMRYSDDVPTLYAAIVLTDVLGFGINKALLAFETLSRRRLGLGT